MLKAILVSTLEEPPLPGNYQGLQEVEVLCWGTFSHIKEECHSCILINTQ